MFLFNAQTVNPLHIITAKKNAPSTAPTAINTVPAGSFDCCIYGAFAVGGTCAVGIGTPVEGSLGRPPRPPDALPGPPVMVASGIGAETVFVPVAASGASLKVKVSSRPAVVVGGGLAAGVFSSAGLLSAGLVSAGLLSAVFVVFGTSTVGAGSAGLFVAGGLAAEAVVGPGASGFGVWRVGRPLFDGLAASLLPSSSSGSAGWAAAVVRCARVFVVR